MAIVTDDLFDTVMGIHPSYHKCRWLTSYIPGRDRAIKEKIAQFRTPSWDYSEHKEK